MSSAGAACSVKTLLTTEAGAGETTLTDGGVVSVWAAATTALAALTRPKPVVSVKLFPSPAVASMMPLTSLALRAGLRDRTRPAMPDTMGVAIDVPERAS